MADSSEALNLLSSFFHSSMTLENRFQSLEDIFLWFDNIKKEERFEVNEIPFSQMDQWFFTENAEKLVHKSGKFFRIEGLKIKTNFGDVEEWEQPIINQPEIGILGILTKVFDGTRYFLMQAKMEPGNVNILQLSPTVQATKSNFSRVHKGKIPTYLEYFIDSSKSKVLIDQLQTEQGGRFLKKRNRNIVIEVSDNIEVLPDFRWLTLGEIKELLKIDNFVNMDARSVISTIPLIDDYIISQLEANPYANNSFITPIGNDILNSITDKTTPYKTIDEIISWYTSQKVEYEITTETIPLSALKSWRITDDNIYNNERFFSVIAVKVSAGTREVSSWTQPLLKDFNIGLLGFVLKKINGVIHFLVQAKVEPGNIDCIELCPTISCSNFEYVKKSPDKPPFFEYFAGTKKQADVIYDALQSEEGGRFYQLQNRNMLVVINDSEQLELPPNYTWMTLNQIMNFMRFEFFNIEARSLISSINFNLESINK